MTAFTIRTLTSGGSDCVSHIMIKVWGAEIVVVHKEIFHYASMPGGASQYHWCAKNAVAESRKLKPQIPLFNETGVPTRDEIELQIQLI